MIVWYSKTASPALPIGARKGSKRSSSTREYLKLCSHRVCSTVCYCSHQIVDVLAWLWTNCAILISQELCNINSHIENSQRLVVLISLIRRQRSSSVRVCSRKAYDQASDGYWLFSQTFSFSLSFSILVGHQWQLRFCLPFLCLIRHVRSWLCSLSVRWGGRFWRALRWLGCSQLSTSSCCWWCQMQVSSITAVWLCSQESPL